MQTWLVRVVLTFWIPLYLGVFHALIVGPLIFYLGPIKSAAIMSLAVGVWSSVFYFLLCQGYKSERAQRHLDQLKERQERGLLVRIGRWFSRHFSRVKGWFAKQFSEKLLPSPLRIFIIFLCPGPLFGVPAVRVAYSAEVTKGALSLIWAGCVASAFFWTVLLGPPISLLRRLAGIIFGGG